MGRMGTASLIILPPEEPQTIICVRPSLINSTTATRRLHQINTAPQLLGPMDSRRRDLLVPTDIPHSLNRSMLKGLRPGREGTGVVGHRRLREDILELDMVLVGSSIHPGHMDNLRPGRADGVATRRDIKLHRPRWDFLVLASILLRAEMVWTSWFLEMPARARRFWRTIHSS